MVSPGPCRVSLAVACLVVCPVPVVRFRWLVLAGGPPATSAPEVFGARYWAHLFSASFLVMARPMLLTARLQRSCT